MKLQIYDREVALPKTAVTTQRNLNIGTQNPKAKSNLANQLDKIGSEVYRKVSAANDVIEYSKVMADAKLKMGVFYSSRSRDADNYDTLTDDTDEYFKKVSYELIKDVGGVTQQARVRQGLEQVGLAMHSKAIGDATTQSIDNTRATHKHTRALMVQEASFGSDDQMRSVFMNYSEQTRTLSKLGVYGDEEAEKDVLDFYNDGARGKVRRLMNESPQAAVDYLLNQETFSRMLKPEHRENLLAQAQRLLDAQGRSAEAAMKSKDALEMKELKQWQEINHVIMYKGILAGDVTSEQLQTKAEHGLLSVQSFESLSQMRLNRNKSFLGDPQMFQMMQEKAWMGELELREVIQAVNSEQINWDWATKLTGEIEQGANIVQTEGYKTHLLALKTAVGWSQSFIPTPRQSEMLSLAVLEFRRRLIAGEDLTTVTSEMIQRYKSSGNTYFPRPRFDSIEEAKKSLPAGRELDFEIKAIQYQQEREAFNSKPAGTK